LVKTLSKNKAKQSIQNLPKELEKSPVNDKKLRQNGHRVFSNSSKKKMEELSRTMLHEPKADLKALYFKMRNCDDK